MTTPAWLRTAFKLLSGSQAAQAKHAEKYRQYFANIKAGRRGYIKQRGQPR